MGGESFGGNVEGDGARFAEEAEMPDSQMKRLIVDWLLAIEKQGRKHCLPV
jgi:hypothetical protein